MHTCSKAPLSSYFGKSKCSLPNRCQPSGDREISPVGEIPIGNCDPTTTTAFSPATTLTDSVTSTIISTNTGFTYAQSTRNPRPCQRKGK